MKMKHFLRSLSMLSLFALPQKSLSHGGGGVEAAARMAWLSVENCVNQAQFEPGLDREALEKSYGEDIKRLYPFGLVIFKENFDFEFYNHKTRKTELINYQCADVFPHFSRMHFPELKDLCLYIAKAKKIPSLFCEAEPLSMPLTLHR